MAYLRRTSVNSSRNSNNKLSGLPFDFLRLELCLAEALSNFERRPLRETQLHYALTLAWCPLMIMHVLLAYNVVHMEDALKMVLRIGLPGAPAEWDRTLRRQVLSTKA